MWLFVTGAILIRDWLVRVAKRSQFYCQLITYFRMTMLRKTWYRANGPPRNCVICLRMALSYPPGWEIGLIGRSAVNVPRNCLRFSFRARITGWMKKSWMKNNCDRKLSRISKYAQRGMLAFSDRRLCDSPNFRKRIRLELRRMFYIIRCLITKLPLTTRTLNN